MRLATSAHWKKDLNNIVGRLLVGSALAAGVSFLFLLTAGNLNLGRWFGEAYASLGLTLSISAWLYFPLGVGVVLQALHFATGRSHQVTVALTMATIVALFLGGALINRWGVSGAAVSKVLVECLLVGLLMRGLPTDRARRVLLYRWAIAAVMISATGMATVLWFLGSPL